MTNRRGMAQDGFGSVMRPGGSLGGTIGVSPLQEGYSRKGGIMPPTQFQERPAPPPAFRPATGPSSPNPPSPAAPSGSTAQGGDKKD